MKLRNKKTGKTINGCFVVCEYKDGKRFSVNDKPVYDSISKLNEDYEDVEEPLIKDEEVRKAVRAWSKANGAWLLSVVSRYRIKVRQVDTEILFNDPVFKDIPTNIQLTIDELCGEEE